MILFLSNGLTKFKRSLSGRLCKAGNSSFKLDENPRETNIWDHRTLIIQNGETEWAKQWLPWAGILWGRRIRKKEILLF